MLLGLDERKHLKIETYPAEYPAIIIRAPVPWHCTFMASSQMLDHKLFIVNPILLRLRDLWEFHYSGMVIVSVDQLRKEFPPPLEAKTLETAVDNYCKESRNILLSRWLPQCAEIFLEMKSCWSHLVPVKAGESMKIIRSFFECVCSLMSMQIRQLVMKSLLHFLGLIAPYKGGNDFGEEFMDYKLNNTPLVTVYVKPVVGTCDLKFEPELHHVRGLVQRCFEKIIQVNQKLPRIDCLLFPEITTSDLWLHAVAAHEEEVCNVAMEALKSFDTNLKGPYSYLKIYQAYLHILNGEAESAMLKFMKTDPFPKLEDFTRRIEEYEALRDDICLLRRLIPLNFFCLDCNEMNETLWKMVDDLRAYLVNYHVENSRTHNKKICDIFDEMLERASELPETTADLVELQNYLNECRDVTMYNLKEKIQTAGENVLFLMQKALLSPEDIHLNSRTFLWPKEMEAVLKLSEARLAHRRDIVEGILRSKRTDFDAKLVLHQKELEIFKKKDAPILTKEEMEENVRTVEKILQVLQEDKKEAKAINEEEQLLGFNSSPFIVLQTMLSIVEPLNELWHIVYSFHINYDRWYYGSFLTLNADTVKDEVDHMWQTLHKLAKILYDIPGAKYVAEMVRARVEKFRQYVPLLQTVCNKGLQERHWQQMSKVVGIELEPTMESTLSEMIDNGLLQHVIKLEEIAVAASKEYALEQNLHKMQQEWDDTEFELVPYRDSGVDILSAVDGIHMMLDDNILKAQAMRGSSYSKAFDTEMQAWETKLISMQDILDAWLECQATWLYLEPIFGSEDIMRQMPEESRKFFKVDKIWRDIMKNTKADKHVLIATDYENMLELLSENNTVLNDIQKGLNDYLEKKRLFFPRFFFLSNNELLEILSKTKDPLCVQPYLKKCFEGIDLLQFTKEQVITGIISAEQEIVSLSGQIIPADAKGMVEKWLSQVEQQMVQSVKDCCKMALQDRFSSPCSKWVLKWPGQAVICGNCMHWTAEVTQSMENGKLADYLTICSSQIDEMVELVRGELTTGTRTKISALIVLDVHARGIVEKLCELKISSPRDFSWISQLRYYWIEEHVVVSVIMTDILYGFEYLGNTPRLVVTPLTDRCYRTLIGALHWSLGGALEGPTGTGKTETTKDLAKALAKQCVVFNCSDGLDYKAMGKFFKGLAQSGAWACFDEFNCITVEVLSVVAQQILSIQMAVHQNLERFLFEGTEISLVKTCAVVVTMNPGCAGRQELPDNLKMLFRAVAMMVPDFVMISEVSLYSMGFMDARSLAEKIVHTYKLCSEQLTLRSHYNYGMRDVKTVLTVAGNLKLKYKDRDEAVIVLQALVDVNLPKFLSQDVPLFEGIYSDLFPGIELPQREGDVLVSSLKECIAQHNLQATPYFMQKIVQVYEMILVRHGLMIVGLPMGGKTHLYQMLAEALTAIRGNANSTMEEFRVQYQIINPKAITLGQLYGCFDPVSHEWSDGVLANIFREYAAAPMPDRKWILFDGPVDAIWIESLNTVLDDSKKLCLMSGEIIQKLKEFPRVSIRSVSKTQCSNGAVSSYRLISKVISATFHTAE